MKRDTLKRSEGERKCWEERVEREGEERLMIAVLQAVSSEQEKSHSPANLESRSINNSPSTVQTRAGVCEREK